MLIECPKRTLVSIVDGVPLRLHEIEQGKVYAQESIIRKKDV